MQINHYDLSLPVCRMHSAYLPIVNERYAMTKSLAVANQLAGANWPTVLFFISSVTVKTELERQYCRQGVQLVRT